MSSYEDRNSPLTQPVTLSGGPLAVTELIRGHEVSREEFTPQRSLQLDQNLLALLHFLVCSDIVSFYSVLWVI